MDPVHLNPSQPGLSHNSPWNCTDVYAEFAALKRTRVFRTELSSLDVNETTILLIKYSRGPTRSSGAGQYVGGYREQSSTTNMPEKSYYGSLGLGGGGRSLSLL